MSLGGQDGTADRATDGSKGASGGFPALEALVRTVSRRAQAARRASELATLSTSRAPGALREAGAGEA